MPGERILKAAITESSQKPKAFWNPKSRNRTKEQSFILSNLFWFTLLCQQINTLKIVSPILTVCHWTMP